MPSETVRAHKILDFLHFHQKHKITTDGQTNSPKGIRGRIYQGHIHGIGGSLLAEKKDTGYLRADRDRGIRIESPTDGQTL